MIPWSGKRRAIIARISSSAPRSAWVTGEASAFDSTARPSERNSGVMKAPRGMYLGFGGTGSFENPVNIEFPDTTVTFTTTAEALRMGMLAGAILNTLVPQQNPSGIRW